MGAAILDDVTVMVADDRSRGYIAVCEEQKKSMALMALWNEGL